MPFEDQNKLDVSNWSVKEILRFMYQELHSLKGDMAKIRDDRTAMEQLDTVRTRLTVIETKIEGQEQAVKKASENSKWWLAGIGLAFTVINFLIQYFKDAGG